MANIHLPFHKCFLLTTRHYSRFWNVTEKKAVSFLMKLTFSNGTQENQEIAILLGGNAQ